MQNVEQMILLRSWDYKCGFFHFSIFRMFRIMILLLSIEAFKNAVSYFYWPGLIDFLGKSSLPFHSLAQALHTLPWSPCSSLQSILYSEATLASFPPLSSHSKTFTGSFFFSLMSELILMPTLQSHDSVIAHSFQPLSKHLRLQLTSL